MPCRLHSLFLAGQILGVFACVAVEGSRRRHKLTKDYDKPGAGLMPLITALRPYLKLKTSLDYIVSSGLAR